MVNITLLTLEAKFGDDRWSYFFSLLVFKIFKYICDFILGQRQCITRRYHRS